MLLRISLIIAILAGLGTGVVSYLQISDQIPAIKKQRDDEHNAKTSEIAAHKRTNDQLKKTQSELAQTQQDLTETKGELAKANSRAEQQGKRADELNDKLTQTAKQRDDAQNKVAAYEASGLTPEQVSKLNKNLKDALTEAGVLKDEKTVLLRKVGSLQAEIERLVGTNSYVLLRRDLHGKIVTVDPKWNFVVLNVGETQGVLNNGELLVSRNGKLIGKVVVTNVQKEHSIANLVPGWTPVDFIEGDEVSPAHPAS